MIIEGLVIPGEGKAGCYYKVPTANLNSETPVSLAQGIYTAYAIFEDKKIPSVVCMGYKLEIHLLNWSGTLYGKKLEVEVLEKISQFVPFQSEEQMKEKITDDIQRAKSFFGL